MRPGASTLPVRWAWPVVVCALALQNAAIYWRHYAGTLTFPWDFQLTYHAVTSFWQTAIRAGIFPTWVPYQGVGYPLPMNLQSGIFYPPLWFFPAFDVTYSLRAATILQVLHVGFGALGMSTFARLRGLSWRYALIAGAAYQVFGGFYSNSEHVDIVRGFAWTPWLLAALTAADGERRPLPLRALLLPALVFSFLTGAYPGQALAGIVLSFVYLGVQLFDLDARRFVRARLPGIGKRAVFLVLGVIMAMVHILPAWLHREELARAQDTLQLTVTGLGPTHLFTTFLSYDAPFLTGDGSMRSLFITIPVVVGLFLVRARDLGAQLPSVALMLAAALMIQAGGVYRLMTVLFPPLGLSRFPAADYRALVAVPAVLLGVLGLRHALDGLSRSFGSALRLCLLVAFLWVGIAKWNQAAALPAPRTGQLAAVLLVTAAVLALRQFRFLGPRLASVAVLLVVAGDGYRMHEGCLPQPWQGLSPGLDYDEMRSQLTAELQTTRDRRPPREDPSLDGYYCGRYVFWDYAASARFRGSEQIKFDDQLASFAQQQGSPVLLAAGTVLDPIGLAILRPLDAALGSVTPELYGPREVRYAVSTRVPAVLVENEPAFPGWTALRCDQGMPLESAEGAWPLRAWKLPAGAYSVSLEFRMPGLLATAIVSAVATGVWLVLLGLASPDLFRALRSRFRCSGAS